MSVVTDRVAAIGRGAAGRLFPGQHDYRAGGVNAGELLEIAWIPRATRPKLRPSSCLPAQSPLQALTFRDRVAHVVHPLVGEHDDVQRLAVRASLSQFL